MCYMPIDDPRQLYHNVAVVLDTAVGRRPMNLTLAAVVHGPKAVLPSEPKEITAVPAVLAKYAGVCQLADVLDYRHSARKPADNAGERCEASDNCACRLVNFSN